MSLASPEKGCLGRDDMTDDHPRTNEITAHVHQFSATTHYTLIFSLYLTVFFSPIFRIQDPHRVDLLPYVYI